MIFTYRHDNHNCFQQVKFISTVDDRIFNPENYFIMKHDSIVCFVALAFQSYITLCCQ